MTKADLIEHLSKRSDLPKRVSAVIIRAICESLASALAAVEKVELRGFGSFRLKVRNALAACNPKTGERVEVARKGMPVFRAGKGLQKAVNVGQGG